MDNEQNLTDGRRRLGWFNISGEVLRRPGHQDLLLAVQKDMAVLSTRDDVMQDKASFLAVGPMFEPVESHQVVPHYEVVVTEGDTPGEYTVQFLREGS